LLGGKVRWMLLGDLKASPSRRRFGLEDEALGELATSIQQMGLLQPIVVRRNEGGDYQIVAGERRWRAAKHAGLAEVPCLIRDLTDSEAQIAALVENIHRRDLSPYERGRALRRIREALDLSWEQVAERLGMSTRMIMRLARYAQIPESVEQKLATEPMTRSHYEALAKLPDNPEAQLQVAEAIRQDKLSGPAANRLALSLLAQDGGEVDAPEEKAPEPGSPAARARRPVASAASARGSDSVMPDRGRVASGVSSQPLKLNCRSSRAPLSSSQRLPSAATARGPGAVRASGGPACVGKVEMALPKRSKMFTWRCTSSLTSTRVSALLPSRGYVLIRRLSKAASATPSPSRVLPIASVVTTTPCVSALANSIAAIAAAAPPPMPL